MRKTVAAFRLSAENLWQPGFRVYFWTFTFNVVLSDTVAMERFRAFLNGLNMALPGNDYSGVRVAELHPGGHGVHFHVLVNRRLSIWIVRRVANCHGIGRISVEVADNQCEHVSKYLSKYLSKSMDGPITATGRSCRRWASFGKVKGCRVKDLINEFPVWVFRRAEKLPWLGYRFEYYLGACWNYGEDCLRSGWYAAKSGRVGDLVALASGMLEARGGGELVWRYPCLENSPF